MNQQNIDEIRKDFEALKNHLAPGEMSPFSGGEESGLKPEMIAPDNQLALMLLRLGLLVLDQQKRLQQLEGSPTAD